MGKSRVRGNLKLKIDTLKIEFKFGISNFKLKNIMKKQFYSHLVEMHLVEEELESLDLSQKEKDELLHHVHSSIHYTVLDVTLDSLPEVHKKTFLAHVNRQDHEKVWEHLKQHTVGIEEKITDVVSKLVSEFLKDIRHVKTKA